MLHGQHVQDISSHQVQTTALVLEDPDESACLQGTSGLLAFQLRIGIHMQCVLVSLAGRV